MDEFFAKYLKKEHVGIEIGPSFNPMVRKREGWNVISVDHLTAEALKEKYRDADVNLDNIEEVDVLWSGGSLLEAVASRYPENKFDYIIASHVLEHLPNPIAFLQDCQQLLKEDGQLLMVVPDKRYMFDYLMPPTTTADFLEAYIKGHSVHPLSTALYTFFLGVNNKGQLSWSKNENVNFEDLRFFIPLEQAYRDWKGYSGEEYVDFHRWFLTEHSFELIVKELHHLQVIDLNIENLFSRSERCDFFVSLKKNLHRNNSSWEAERIQLFRKAFMDIGEQLAHSQIIVHQTEDQIAKENSALKHELQEIYNSKAWKLALKLRSLKVKIFPPGSLQSRILKL